MPSVRAPQKPKTPLSAVPKALLGLPPNIRALGIDPGLSGAACLVQTDPQGRPWVLDHMDFEAFRRGESKTDVRYWNLSQLTSSLQWLLAQAHVAAIEDVQVQNAASSQTSMFKMGWSKGVLEGVCQSYSSTGHIFYFKPQVWKPMLGLSQDKSKSIELAKRVLISGPVDFLKYKKHADRAEAALLAVLGAKALQGGI